MSIALTWANLSAMVGLIAVVLAGLVAGTGAMVEWRFQAVQHQLADRFAIYNNQMDRIEQRLEHLEAGRNAK